MRRLLIGVLVAAAVAGAVLLPQPDPAPEPLAGIVIEDPGLSSPAEASIWYCAWAQATGARDSFVAVASLEEATADFTFPNPIPNEEPDLKTLETLGPGASGFTLSSVARRGFAPSFVEFSDGPAAASVIVSGENVLAADACAAEGPSVWHFPGGSTMQGEHLTLRIFNPFPEAARVTITAASDIGIEALGDLRGLTIGARSWRDIELDTLLRLRRNLVVNVETEDGVVIPAMSWGTGTDEDWWSGVGESETWEFPVAGIEDAATSLVIANHGVSTATAIVDVFTADGAVLDAFVEDVPADGVIRIDLAGYAGADLAALVSANGPVSAAVTASGEAGAAVMSGIPIRSQAWLVPGLRGSLVGGSSLWLLNTSTEAVSVTVSALTNTGLVGEKVVVEPLRPYRVEVADPDARGYLVEASSPFTVAWSVHGPGALGFAPGSPVGETAMAGGGSGDY